MATTIASGTVCAAIASTIAAESAPVRASEASAAPSPAWCAITAA